MFEVDKHIQKLLRGKHGDTFTAIWSYRKADEKLGFDEKKGTKSFSKAFFFFPETYLLQGVNYMTQEGLELGI